MDPTEMAKGLQGLHTATSVAKALGVGRRTAVNYISELRKHGYVKTTRGAGKVRIYEISPIRIKKTGEDLYDFINSRSPIKIRKPYGYIIHGDLTAEEVIVRAIETKDFRTILASMHLFKLVKNWPLLNKHAKKRGLQKAVGALYDLSRKFMRVRAMDKRTRNALLAAPGGGFIIPGMKSKDFQEINKLWRVRLPFSKGDMRRYE